MPTWGTAAELAEVVELARSGAIHAETEVFDIEDTIDAYGRLRNGDVLGRAVVVPRQ
jgi:propanol-preferring alcohol dehydrogenase